MKAATVAVLVGVIIALVAGVDPWYIVGVGIAGSLYLVLFLWLFDVLRWVRRSLTGRGRESSGIVRVESRVGTYERNTRASGMRKVSDDDNPFRSDVG